MSSAKSPDQKFKLQLSLLNGETHEFDLSKRYTVDKELIFNKIRSLNGASRLDYQLGFSRDSRLTVEFVKFADCHEDIKKQFESVVPGEPVTVKLTLFPRSSKKLHRQLSVSAIPSLRNATITHKKLGSFMGGGRVFDVPRTSIDHDAPMPEPIRADVAQVREDVLGIPAPGGLSPRALKMAASSAGSAPPSAVKSRPTASEIFSASATELPLDLSPRLTDGSNGSNSHQASSSSPPAIVSPSAADLASSTSSSASSSPSKLASTAPATPSAQQASASTADSVTKNKPPSDSSVISSTTPRSSLNGDSDSDISDDSDSDYMSVESSTEEEDDEDVEDRRTVRAASFSAVDLQTVSSKAGSRTRIVVGGSSPEYEPILAMSPTQSSRKEGGEKRDKSVVSSIQTRGLRNRSGSAIDMQAGSSSPSSPGSTPHTSRSDLGTIAEENSSAGSGSRSVKPAKDKKKTKSKLGPDGEKLKSKRSKTKVSSSSTSNKADKADKAEKKDKKDKREKEKEKDKEKKKKKLKHSDKTSLPSPKSPTTTTTAAAAATTTTTTSPSSSLILTPSTPTKPSEEKPKKPHKLEKASSALGTISPKAERSAKRKKSGSMLDQVGSGSSASLGEDLGPNFASPRISATITESGDREQRDTSPSPSVTPRSQRRSRVLKKDSYMEGDEYLGISHDSSSSSVPTARANITTAPGATGSATMNTSTSFTPGSGSTSGFASASAHSPASPQQEYLASSREQRDSKGSLGVQEIRDLKDLKEQLESTTEVPPQLSGRSRSTSKEKVHYARERELTPPRRGAGVISPPRVSSSASSSALASSSTPTHQHTKINSKSTSLTPPSTSAILSRSVDIGIASPAPGSHKTASSGPGSGKLASSSTGDDVEILDISDEDPFDETDPQISARLRISDDDMYSTIRRGSRPSLFQPTTRMRSNSLLANEVFAVAVAPSKMIIREAGARPSYAEMRSGSFSMDSRASISRVNREIAEMPETTSQSKRKTHERSYPTLRNAPPLMRPCRGFWVEVGREAITPELLLSEGTFPIENSADDNLWYAEYFAANPHSNYIGVDSSGDVFILSVIRPHGGNMIRALLRTKRGDERHIFVESKQTAKIFKSKIPVQEVLRLFAPSLGASKIRVAKDLNLIYDLMAFEERLRVRTYKFGVLLCKEGQTKEEEMFSNEYGSEEYDNFLNMLGETVRLKGFEKFRGGLDTERDSTGSHSVYTQFEGNEIMFHVSTMLPFSTDNPQQLERKRHLGNDIVVLVFKEGNTPYIPNTISSDFIHVIGIVQPEVQNDRVYYRLSIASKDGVPPFSPALPTTGLFEPGIAFRNLILTKLINGERAAYKSPAFAGKFQRTRAIMLKDIDDRFK